MKRILIISGAVIMLFAFGDTSQNSFSQQVRQARPSPAAVESTKAVVQDRKFKVDTLYLNQLVEEKLDSLKKEYEITATSTSKGKEIIKVQKVNESNLREVRMILNKSLRVANQEAFKLPEIELINAKKKPSPLPVDIKPLEPDTLIVPVERKGFLHFLRFWK